ncbi:glycosyltransferase family 2 protein [Rhizorhabdus histidinilytica]
MPSPKRSLASRPFPPDDGQPEPIGVARSIGQSVKHDLSRYRRGGDRPQRGDRLAHCLRSVEGMRTVYVDSGSSDGSADRARAAGAEVIELDAAGGFSAARGRNAGIERLLADPAIIHVQLLDGDTRLDPGWLAAGKAALDADPALGAVFGRLREQDADGSIYRWMCDLEWAVPSGLADAFGGNVLARAAALRDTGLYRADLIAGRIPITRCACERAAGASCRSPCRWASMIRGSTASASGGGGRSGRAVVSPRWRRCTLRWRPLAMRAAGPVSCSGPVCSLSWRLPGWHWGSRSIAAGCCWRSPRCWSSRRRPSG